MYQHDGYDFWAIWLQSYGYHPLTAHGLETMKPTCANHSPGPAPLGSPGGLDGIVPTISSNLVVVRHLENQGANLFEHFSTIGVYLLSQFNKEWN